MPKRASDDIDHVPIEPPAKKHKKAPPEQWQLPKFKPQATTGAPTHGYGFCSISLCNHIRCWKDHLDAIQ